MNWVCRCGSECFATLPPPEGSCHHGEVVCYECATHKKWASLADYNIAPVPPQKEIDRLRAMRDVYRPRVPVEQGRLL